MTLTVDAIYEDEPLEPLDALKEHDRVRITVHRVGLVADQRGHRLMIDPGIAHEIAESPEHDLLA